ncbi:BTB/POZ domain-containing protein KCTD14 isoform X1 [Meriones unguiculatus]|uniref:BTB/POZ domain-containing protein KCTD14 isoform X1 n=1 Tax=Meriones unguiculatus TaxID=10047 RepID=UPI000B4F0264|nr:BTB/POZ domain-containing protein KCTD14 isoform X1 [Meriones unguiculatus]
MSLPANHLKLPSQVSLPANQIKEHSHESQPGNQLKEHSQESQTLCPDPHLVVELNVGGQLYTTTMGTLMKHPGSKFPEILSRSARHHRDAQGRFFIDRPGTYFGLLLDYLRTGQVPREYIPEVYHEAKFYQIHLLVKALEDTPQIFGEQVARMQFLMGVPNYRENLAVLLHLARAEGVAMRSSKVMVCVVRTEEEDAKCVEPLHILEAQKTPVVKFGPWKVGPAMEDFVYCLEKDIRAQGYWVSSHRSVNKGSYKHFWVFSFTWW